LDHLLDTLVDFAASAELASVPERAILAATRRYLDSVGCAAGALDAEPSRIARRIAATARSTEGVSAFGLPERTTPEYATFANSAATRYLDYNDGYAGIAPNGGVHPSDAAPAIVAAVEMIGGGGRDILLGMYIAYEIAATIADEIPLREKGWDQGANISIAAAAAVGRLLGLDREALGHAIAISITPSMPLHVARTGELSHWKGCAGPQAASGAIWAARLAQAGMTGPARPFEGVQGFCEVVAPATLSRLGEPVDGRLGLERVFTKALPACGHALAPVEAVMRIRQKVAPEEIAALDIKTYRVAWNAIGGGAGDAAEKWDPKTRETADHSLPYLAAIALRDGTVGLDSFEPDRIADARLRPLMRRMTVELDEEMERRFQDDQVMASRIVVRLRDGSVLEEGADSSRGKPDLPMTDDEFSAKFMTMARKVLPGPEAEKMLDLLWSLQELPKLDELTSLYRRWSVGIKL
jgi:2-methylcitrate dehydratase